MINALESSSTRPYLIRALYEWCTDNGFTPYVAVQVDDTVQVPREYVKNGEIVLNISFDATSSLKLGNDFIAFKARFAGTAREINVPIGRVIAIYARENGQGMAFPAPASAASAPGQPASVDGPAPALRDASRPDGDPKIMHLVTGDELTDESVADASAGDGEPPRPPPATGGAKPSLKRIK
ncbi:ClpXP protease specificity-enhancing factor [Variovorax sp. PAMC 28711]|uniref:ClpXP protease specificity-enhancing factor n=1 Tax=Variovorax sp. PAMC 28711 TaxID=1795631 RepID=UPI00078DA352|nr:ClpXP protease specificity-enhancing factor [Variovorax sp. PAMC 28711]AMM23840.1 stringent starvation protein B [Variovorax sp. PAMC 28711]